MLTASADLTLPAGNYTTAPTVSGTKCDYSNTSNWGDPLRTTACADYFPIIYVKGDLKIQANSIAQGVLLVDGSVEMAGNFTFNGIMRALDAGCDVLLGPSHLDSLVDTLDRCVRDGPLYEDRIEQSRRRRLKWAQWAAPQTDYRRVSGSDVAWALQLAERVVTQIRGTVTRPDQGAEIVIVDDDEPCVPAHPRTAFAQALESSQVAASIVSEPTLGRSVPVLVAVFGELRGHRYELAYRPESLEKISQVCLAAARDRRQAVIVLFAPPVLASQILGSAPIVCAWSSDRCMQEAAARWLLRTAGDGRRATGDG